MVGLDAAGKTTILYKLKLGEGPSTRRRLVPLFVTSFWIVGPARLTPLQPPPFAFHSASPLSLPQQSSRPFPPLVCK